MSSTALTKAGPRSRVYVWQLPVRLTHWLIVLSILLLAATGFYIGHPILIVSGEARMRFVMGTVRIVHFYTAWVFIGALVARLFWMFTGNKWSRWDQFLPVRPERYKGIAPTLAFYLFLRKRPPAVIGHNPVAGLTYTLVFGLCLVEILTGFTLYGSSANAGWLMSRFAALAPLMGGLQLGRWIHHVVMWLLLGFMVHHVYSALLMSITEGDGTTESIFSGNKFIASEEIGPERKKDG